MSRGLWITAVLICGAAFMAATGGKEAAKGTVRPAQQASTSGELAESKREDSRPNVLFLPIDDLNDWVGCLGNTQVKTPNLDRLAASGQLFTNAHCAAPSCNPSRTAVLLGRAPHETGIFSNAQPPDANVPDLVSLPRQFRDNGYHVAGGGKIYHDFAGFNRASDWDQWYSWEAEMTPEEMEFWNVRVFDWIALETADDAQPDFKVASWAADFLSQEHDEPFFLAAGIFRPHLPWYVPAAYFEAHPMDELTLPEVPDDDLSDVPLPGKKIARGNSNHAKLVEMGRWPNAVQGYLASIAFADKMVGRILDALEKGPNAKDTIVVAWGDHGYHLGEKQHWHKFTLWERSTHVPLIVRVPETTRAGTRCNAAVGLIDLYPTLLELCGIDSSVELTGRSLTDLLTEPDKEWPFGVLTTYRPGNHSIRMGDWHMIQYAEGPRELYDLAQDPNEWNNLARRKKYKQKISELAAFLPKAEVPAGKNYHKHVQWDAERAEWQQQEAPREEQQDGH
ncbi:MAG: arylsulfatase A-like enzyme [Planctomycetota bacterium]|jgi:arylsulfatase A-like enzyme